MGAVRKDIMFCIGILLDRYDREETNNPDSSFHFVVKCPKPQSPVCSFTSASIDLLRRRLPEPRGRQ